MICANCTLDSCEDCNLAELAILNKDFLTIQKQTIKDFQIGDLVLFVYQNLVNISINEVIGRVVGFESEWGVNVLFYQKEAPAICLPNNLKKIDEAINSLRGN